MLTTLRKEEKYIMYKHEFALIRNKLVAIMQQDKYGKDFGYRVRSVYFDSIYDADLYSSLDGLSEKIKIRLRTYSNDSQIKLEIKYENNNISKKESIILSKEEAVLMESHQYGFLAKRTEAVARKIYMRLLQGAYRPVTLIEYDREAYTYPMGDIRITFDTNTRVTPSVISIFEKEPVFSNVVSNAIGVLEVKYSHVLPAHIKEIINIDKQALANSKYVQSRMFYQFGGEIL